MAEALYDGEQHRRLMKGVYSARRLQRDWEVDLRIVSAGHGVVDGRQLIETYNRTFAGMDVVSADELARELGIAQSIQAAFGTRHDLALVLLGSTYLRAAELDRMTGFPAPTFIFGGSIAARRFRHLEAALMVPAGKDEARRFSCGLVGLKGELAGRVLISLARDPGLLSRLPEAPFEQLLADDQLQMALAA